MHRWRTALAVIPLAAAALVGASAPQAGASVPDRWASSYATGANTAENAGEHVITAATASRVSRSWQATGGIVGFVAPVIVDGVVYQAFNGGSLAEVSRLVALDARTGKRLWSTSLAGDGAAYYRGASVSGHVIVLPFEGWHQLGGVTAVDLTTHKLLWSRSRPPSTTDPGNDDGTGGPVVVDSGRVYLDAGNNDLSAYDLATGRLLWHQNPTGGPVDGIAAAGGRFYTGGTVGAAGSALVVYDGATGRRSWTSPYLYGRPVIAGSTVVIASGRGVAGLSATGCAHPTCSPRWNTAIPNAQTVDTLIGGADSTTTFLTATLSDDTSRLIRLNTATGHVQWTAKRPHHSGEIPVRAGNTVWLLENGDTILGWSATATTTQPLRTITVPSNNQGVVGGLAVASGSLVHEAWPFTLTAYRVPGS